MGEKQLYTLHSITDLIVYKNNTLTPIIIWKTIEKMIRNNFNSSTDLQNVITQIGKQKNY